MTQIIHGNRGAGYASINLAGETPAFGVPVALPGFVSASIETEQSTKKIYADNVVAFVATGARIKTAKATFLSIPESFAVAALGMVKAANGMVTDTGTQNPICFFFIQDAVDPDTNSQTQILHYLYDAKVLEPTRESETDSEEITEQTLELSLECRQSDIATDVNGTAVQYGYIMRTEDNAELFDSYMDGVILPTDTVAGA